MNNNIPLLLGIMSSTEFVSTDIESSDIFENNINNEQNDGEYC